MDDRPKIASASYSIDMSDKHCDPAAAAGILRLVPKRLLHAQGFAARDCTEINILF